MSWQYGIPALMTLVCLDLAFWGLAAWSAAAQRRAKRQTRSVESKHAISDRPAASD